MHSGYSIGKVGVIRPVLIGCKAGTEMAAMGMGINKSGHNCFAFAVNHPGMGRYSYLAGAAYGFNQIAINNNGSIIYLFSTLHCNDVCMRKCD